MIDVGSSIINFFLEVMLRYMAVLYLDFLLSCKKVALNYSAASPSCSNVLSLWFDWKLKKKFSFIMPTWFPIGSTTYLFCNSTFCYFHLVFKYFESKLISFLCLLCSSFQIFSFDILKFRCFIYTTLNFHGINQTCTFYEKIL